MKNKIVLVSLGAGLCLCGVSLKGAAPAFVTQPRNQSVSVGPNVVFSVRVTGEANFLPLVSSGTLQLWLKADAGVVTSGGSVVQWQDQSGNGNHAEQNNIDQQPSLVQGAVPISAQPAVRFDGILTNHLGDFLQGAGDVGIRDGYTSFLVSLRANRVNNEQLPAVVGIPGSRGVIRGYYENMDKMAFTAWSNDYLTSQFIPPDSFRIWTDRLNDTKTLIELFDHDGTSAIALTANTSGLADPAPGYFVGGIDFSTIFDFQHYAFKGDIAELIYYQGALSEIDRLAVEHYLQQKYLQVQQPPDGAIRYQWFFNGTTILDATNYFLAITNAQFTNAGNYRVTVSNDAGGITSSNAFLAVGVKPQITTPPQNQRVGSGAQAMFSVEATGTAPLLYQWQRNSADVLDATNSSLIVTNVQTPVLGSYRVLVSNPFGSVTSSVATLTFLTSTARVVSVTSPAGSAFAVPIQLISAGDENSLSFSLSFNTSTLVFSNVVAGSNSSGATLIVNTNSLNSGRVGIVLALAAGVTFPTGTQEVARVIFRTAVTLNPTSSSINFGDAPIARQILGTEESSLPGAYLNGTVTITAADFEGDTSPRPNGNRSLSVGDWTQVGKFVAGLDTAAAGTEFQRADCAPRSSAGNGFITIADWVQAGRYAFGADAIAAIGGPTNISGTFIPETISSNRFVRLEALSQTGLTNVLAVKLVAQGDENAMGFSVSYNTNELTFMSAALGNNASGALLNINSNSAALGRVGLALSLPTGSSFTSGTQEVVRLTFVRSSSATGTSTISFFDSPVPREVADAFANSRPAAYSGNFFLNISLPRLSIVNTTNQLLLSWPSSAVGFILEKASRLNTNWSALPLNQMTNGATVNAILPASEQESYYRLRQQ